MEDVGSTEILFDDSAYVVLDVALHRPYQGSSHLVGAGVDRPHCRVGD